MSLSSTYGYAYQFDATLFDPFMRTFGQSIGVTRHEGLVTQVERDGDTGNVTALILKDGRRIEGDLFLGALVSRGCGRVLDHRLLDTHLVGNALGQRAEFHLGEETHQRLGVRVLHFQLFHTAFAREELIILPWRQHRFFLFRHHRCLTNRGHGRFFLCFFAFHGRFGDGNRHIHIGCLCINRSIGRQHSGHRASHRYISEYLHAFIVYCCAHA